MTVCTNNEVKIWQRAPFEIQLKHHFHSNEKIVEVSTFSCSRFDAIGFKNEEGGITLIQGDFINSR